VWEYLNDLHPDTFLREGRVYGGGLHKLEPNELGNVDVAIIADQITELCEQTQVHQLSLFD
jgi:hypothetical protein